MGGSGTAAESSAGGIAIGGNVAWADICSLFNTVSLSDFAKGWSGRLPAIVTTSEASALASDAIPTFAAISAPRLIKQIRATQMVLNIEGLGMYRSSS